MFQQRMAAFSNFIFACYPEMEKFIEMCFDPGSPMNEKLKETLKQMLKEGAE